MLKSVCQAIGSKIKIYVFTRGVNCVHIFKVKARFCERYLGAIFLKNSLEKIVIYGIITVELCILNGSKAVKIEPHVYGGRDNEATWKSPR